MMTRKTYTEEQIYNAIQKHESGVDADSVCAEIGISKGTFYNWRSYFAGMNLQEMKRLKALQSENNLLKKLLASKVIENVALRDVILKKW